MLITKYVMGKENSDFKIHVNHIFKHSSASTFV